jgi:hypothetical protein
LPSGRRALLGALAGWAPTYCFLREALLIASGAEIARAISGARDITREELIHHMSKVTKMIERVLTTPQWLVK